MESYFAYKLFDLLIGIGLIYLFIAGICCVAVYLCHKSEERFLNKRERMVKKRFVLFYIVSLIPVVHIVFFIWVGLARVRRRRQW